MGNDELKFFKRVETEHGKQALKEAMDMTTQDIKFNQIGFGKVTGKHEFMGVFCRCLNIVVRS